MHDRARVKAIARASGVPMDTYQDTHYFPPRYLAKDLSNRKVKRYLRFKWTERALSQHPTLTDLWQGAREEFPDARLLRVPGSEDLTYGIAITLPPFEGDPK
ncbi:MAG TPA: hypothetical protein VJA25_00155 [Dehalococcoidia bacterium]|nr:hypothetical protein [Dehalococcoidia bacterium]